jgi:hypothetical protein
MKRLLIWQTRRKSSEMTSKWTCSHFRKKIFGAPRVY